MADRLPLLLNGVDFSTYANKNGYSIRYEDRMGPCSGQLQDGTEIYDLQARKAVVTWSLNDLPGDKLAEVLQICEERYVAVTVLDTKLNAPRSMVCIPTVGEQKMLLTTQEGVRWFTGQILTLRER